MCGRAYETYSNEELYFRYLSKPPLTPLVLLPIYNLCPTQDSPVLRLVHAKRKTARNASSFWRPTGSISCSSMMVHLCERQSRLTGSLGGTYHHAIHTSPPPWRLCYNDCDLSDSTHRTRTS